MTPPTRPVATTGTPSAFSARATLIPFPPASVTPALARWRCPRWKFGTVSVRSTAALSVTVTITGRRRTSGGDGRSSWRTSVPGPRDRAARRRASRRGRGCRRACLRSRPGRWPSTSPAVTGSETTRLADTRSTNGRPTRATASSAFAGRSGTGAQAVGQADRGVDAARLDRRDDPELRQPPAEQRLEAGVADAARGAAEDRRVDGHAPPAHRGDLAPARVPGVAGLHAEHVRERRRGGRPRCAAPARPGSWRSRWRTSSRTTRVRIAIARELSSRRRRSSTRRARRARPGGRSACRAAPARRPWRSSASRTPESSARPTARARRRRRSPTG